MFLAAVLLLGVGVRIERGRRPAPAATSAERAALRRQIARVESVATRGARHPKTRPRMPDSPPTQADRDAGPLDLDVATAVRIEQLPRIGPALAARIVADRDSNGPYGSLDELQRVRGIGPALARQLAPLVTFSLQPRPRSKPSGVRPRAPPARQTRERGRRA